jgi:anti-sigma B factor antagonist
MRGFSLTVGQLAPDVVCVGLSGELDMSRALLLEQELRAVEDTGPSCIVIDLSELHFVDSSGLARLIAAHRRSERAGWRLVLVRGSGAVQRLLSLSALDKAFVFVGRPEDALSLAPS